MGRLLAIDYGTKRTGIAVSDPLKIIATPLTGIQTHELFDFLDDYLSREEVEEVVVGWPTRDDGSDTNNTKNVKAFINRFKKIFPNMPVVLQDEWGTSREAVSSMVKSGTKKKNRRNKLNVDKASAVLILQDYMSQS